MPFNPIDNNMANLQILFNQVNQTTPSDQNNMVNSLLSSSQDMVTASFLGQRFSEYYEAVRESGDELALEGVRSLAVEMSTNYDSEVAMDFVQALDNMAEESPESMTRFFALSNEILSEGHGFQPWLNTFLELDSSSMRQEYLQATSDIVSSEGENISETFSLFVQTISQMINESQDDESLAEELGAFFSGLGQMDALDDMHAFMERFPEGI